MNDQPTIEVQTPTAAATESESGADAPTLTAAEPLVHETLVEEVSIDGMCGVY